jgi:hypothetical protein
MRHALAAVLAPLLAATFAAAATAAERDLSAVEVKVETLAPGVAMLTGAGGNLALVHGASGAFLVDDQYAPMSAKILAAVGSVTKAPLRSSSTPTGTATTLAATRRWAPPARSSWRTRTSASGCRPISSSPSGNPRCRRRRRPRCRS